MAEMCLRNRGRFNGGYKYYQETVKPTAQAIQRLNNKNTERFVPPNNESLLSINPQTGRPYVEDELYRSRSDYVEAVPDALQIGKGIGSLEGGYSKAEKVTKAVKKVQEESCKN